MPFSEKGQSVKSCPFPKPNIMVICNVDSKHLCSGLMSSTNFLPTIQPLLIIVCYAVPFNHKTHAVLNVEHTQGLAFSFLC